MSLFHHPTYLEASQCKTPFCFCTGRFIHDHLVTASQLYTDITFEPPRQSSSPKTRMLAPSTDKTHFTATLQSTGLKPPQRASNTVRRRTLIGMTSLNSISCLERNVPTVMAAHYPHRMGIPIACLSGNDKAKPNI